MVTWQKYMGIGEPGYFPRMESPFMAGQRQAREMVLGIWKRKTSFWEEKQGIFSKGVNAKAESFVVAFQWQRRKYLFSEVSLKHPLLSEKWHLIYNFRKLRKQVFFLFFSLSPLSLPPSAPPHFYGIKAKSWDYGMQTEKKRSPRFFSGFFLSKFNVLFSS